MLSTVLSCEHYLRCNGKKCGRNLLMFQRKQMFLFSALEIEVVGSPNIGQFLPHYTASHLRGYYCLYAGIIVPCFKHILFSQTVNLPLNILYTISLY